VEFGGSVAVKWPPVAVTVVETPEGPETVRATVAFSGAPLEVTSDPAIGTPRVVSEIDR